MFLVTVLAALAILGGLQLFHDRTRMLWILCTGVLFLVMGKLMISQELVSGTGADREFVLAVAALALLGAVLYGLSREVGKLRIEKRNSDEHHDSLVANLPMVVASVDRRGRAEFRNPARLQALASHLGQGRARFADFGSLFHADDVARVKQGLSRAFSGETVRVEGRLRDGSGTWRCTETLLYPQQNGQGVIAVNALTSDVTDRRLLEEQLRHSQKMESLGVMGSGIAHDFNNLLSSILANIELASRKIPWEHAAQKNLEDAARIALRASEHTRQLLGFTHRTVANPRAVSVNEVCQEAAALVRPTVDPRIEFVLRAEPHLWYTSGDQGELVQLLVNLLLNARDVLPDGGRVTVETSNVLLDETYARAHAEGRPGEFVSLVVTDNGPGMPSEIRTRIFEPFFTTKGPGQGTGLGLSMVYGTVRRHGGWIQCHSEVGLGTRFAVYLPRDTTSIASKPAAPQSEEEGAIPRGSETVLLVDDESDVRMVGVEALQELGYSVLTAQDGVEALETFRSEQARIRIVILDLSMPRMNGRDTLTRLQQIDPTVRVLLTSGHAPDVETEALFASGAVGFIGKPYRLAELAFALRAALEQEPFAVGGPLPRSEPGLSVSGSVR